MTQTHRIAIAITLSFAALAFAHAVNAQTPTWKASIVSVSADSPQFVSGGGKNWPGRPAAHRWIVLTVQVTSPGKDAKVPAAEIQLVSKDASYPATAISHQVKPTDSIVYLPLLILEQPHTDQGMAEGKGNPKTGGGWSTLSNLSADKKRLEPVSVGFFEKMDIKKMLFNVLLKGASGGREVQVMKSPLNLVLLFAVPSGATDLQLKFGDADAVAIQTP